MTERLKEIIGDMAREENYGERHTLAVEASALIGANGDFLQSIQIDHDERERKSKEQISKLIDIAYKITNR